MSNYKRPFRNLPAEIRLLIWEFTVPSKVTIFGPVPKPDSAWSNFRSLELIPALQTQLLLVNKKVHNEALPLIRRSEIFLKKSPAAGTVDHRKLERAWQSRTFFGVLHYILESHDYKPSFLFDFLELQKPPTPRKLRIKIFEAGGSFQFFDGKGRPYKVPKPERMITTFASAAISRGLVSEVQVDVEAEPSSQISLWEPGILRGHLLDSDATDSQSLVIDGPHSNNDFFHNEVLKTLGRIAPSKVQITTEVAKNGWAAHAENFFTLIIRYKLSSDSSEHLGGHPGA